jgi:hypothetical protein
VRSEPLDPASVRATVVDVAFLGAQRTVRLESSAVGGLVATTVTGETRLERGAEVGVTWSAAHAWAVAV